MKLNKSKIERFHEYIIEDYNKSLVIEDIANVKTTKETDGSFIQIGIRPLLDEDILVEESNLAPELPSAGRIVAIGERDFLIKSILDNKEIETTKFNEDIKEFPRYVFDFTNAVILISTKFYVEIFTKLAYRIDYDEKYPRLDRIYRIISVPEEVMKNKIIVIDKEAILWEKQKFHNEVTDKDEKIKIDINPRTGGKVDITIKSVNKIKYLNPDLIKILEFEEKKIIEESLK